MSDIYTITPELRDKLKDPFGVLVKGTFDQTMAKMGEIQKQNPPKIISVGDIVTKNLLKYNIPPDVAIVDNQSMRKKLQPSEHIVEGIKVKNPQGTITKEAIEAIKKALKNSKQAQHIIVDGEEDLLTIIAVLYAPEKSVVVYGQPYEGIVLVEVSPEKKIEASKFLKEMENVRKAK
jgi:uncharacterized protein (UPF0218 family)